VRKTPSWPGSWANFSPSHRSAWANLRLLGQPNTSLAASDESETNITLRHFRQDSLRGDAVMVDDPLMPNIGGSPTPCPHLQCSILRGCRADFTAVTCYLVTFFKS
jgi:hypothetical protein